MHTSLLRSCHPLHCFVSNCRCLITPCRKCPVLRKCISGYRHMSSARVIIWRSIPRFSFSVVLYGAMTWIARRELFVFNHFFKYKTEMKYSLIAILLFSFTALQAQVKGTVKDNLGDPIAGANLFWQGTTQGTTTSADGTFSLSKPNDKHMLVVSFIGFENDTIHVSNRNETLDIVLREGVELSEVNVVSRKLGTMKLRNSVMNEDMISSAELSRAACCNLGESFVTNPSVDVTYSDAATGAKQIKLLGLSGTYVQMMTENIPNYRGSAAPYGLGYVPGPWMQSIQVSKGSSSVKNGYEAITGQNQCGIQETPVARSRLVLRQSLCQQY